MSNYEDHHMDLKQDYISTLEIGNIIRLKSDIIPTMLMTVDRVFKDPIKRITYVYAAGINKDGTLIEYKFDERMVVKVTR